MPQHLLGLKATIVSQGRTQTDVARAVRVSPAVLCHVIGGHEIAWPALRQRLAAELGVHEEILFDPDATFAAVQ